MNTRPKDRTPHVWSEADDAECCIGCERPFKRGDMVVNDCAVTVHHTKECIDQYNADLKELGLA